MASWPAVYLLIHSRPVRAARTYQTLSGGAADETTEGFLGASRQPDLPQLPHSHAVVRSELGRDTPSTMIAHLFVCPNCKRAQRQDADFAPVVVSPDKLASPRFQVIDGGKRATLKALRFVAP